MGPTPIEDGKGLGYTAEVDANRDLHTRTRLVDSAGVNEAEVNANGELLTRSAIESGGNELAIDSGGALSANASIVGGGNTASVDSNGRLLTKALVPCVSKTVYTNYLSAAQNTVATVNSRSDRCAMFFMNTGSNVVHFRLAATDPTSSDLQLAVGEKFTVPFTTDTEVRFTSLAGAWSVVAVEGAES